MFSLKTNMLLSLVAAGLLAFSGAASAGSNGGSQVSHTMVQLTNPTVYDFGNLLDNPNCNVPKSFAGNPFASLQMADLGGGVWEFLLDIHNPLNPSVPTFSNSFGSSAFSDWIYAEFACAEFGLAFRDLDGGSGLTFSVASRNRLLHFGAGRCSWYPQNGATASTLASDKHFASRSCERPACRRSAVNISSCTTATARIARQDTSAATPSNVSEDWARGLRQAAYGIARRFRASHSRRSRAGSISR